MKELLSREPQLAISPHEVTDVTDSIRDKSLEQHRLCTLSNYELRNMGYKYSVYFYLKNDSSAKPVSSFVSGSELLESSRQLARTLEEIESITSVNSFAEFVVCKLRNDYDVSLNHKEEA